MFAQACVRIYEVCLFMLENDAYLVGKDRNITRLRGNNEHKKETGYTCVQITVN